MKIKAFFWTNRIYNRVLCKNSKFYYLAHITVMAAMSASQIFNLYFLKVFVDAILEKGNFRLAILWLFLNFIVRFSTDQIISWARVYIKQASMKAQIEMQQMVLKKCFDFDLSVFEDTVFYDTFTRAFQYASTSSEIVISTVFSIASDIIGLSAVVYIIAQLDVFVFLILLGVVIVDLIVNMKRDKMVDILKRKITRIKRKQNYITALLNKKTTFKDLKINNAEAYILDKMYQVLSLCEKEAIDVEKKSNFYKIPVRLLETIFVIVTYFFIGRDLFSGGITIGDFNMTFNAAYSIKSYLITIGASISGLKKESLNAAYFYEFFTYKAQKRGYKKLDDKKNITIEFENVSFKYSEEQEWIINDVSFSIATGETVLLIGENGAGKSTLINLLLRLYPLNKGRILINGIDIQEYDIKEIYSNVAIVFQDHQEYAFSVAENVFLEDDRRIIGTDREIELQETLISIGLDKLQDSSFGLYSSLTRELDPDGFDLSGGERQKLAIARAFMKKAGFFIMDEPSSSLDPIAEENIYQNFKKLTAGSTSLIVSHHLSNSIYADRILVMESGRIIECGSHTALIEKGGTYAKLYNLQKNKFVKN